MAGFEGLVSRYYSKGPFLGPFLCLRDKRIQVLTCDACHVFTSMEGATYLNETHKPR